MVHTQDEVLPRPRVRLHKKLHPQTGGLQPLKGGSRSTDKAKGVPNASFLNVVLAKLSVSLGIFIAAIALIVWLSTGFLLGKIDPEYTVTVQQFEIAPEIAKQLSLSGKSASDIVVDTLNDAEAHSSRFQGTEYYEYDGAVTQSVLLKQTIKVPVQTAYGIEVKGVSLDSLVQLYNRNRYQQWLIGGDVFATPDGLVGRIRLNRAEAARFWETSASAGASPSELIRRATYVMLASECPELLARSYLQQRRYEEAGAVLREWATAEPRNWRPSYYLSLVYSYQEKVADGYRERLSDTKGNTLKREAAELALWSENIADHEKTTLPLEVRQALEIEVQQSPDLPKLPRALQEARLVTGLRSASLAGPRRQTQEWLHGLLASLPLRRSDPVAADFSIREAKRLDDTALAEDAAGQHNAALQHLELALVHLDAALAQLPDNGGLHEQWAMLRKHQIVILNQTGDEAASIARKKEEAVQAFTRALELRPTASSALWAAVYAQLELGHSDDAIHLAQTIALLVPQSTVASLATVVALEGNQAAFASDPAKVEEVDVRMKTLLKADLDPGQLQTLLNAFEKSGDRKSFDRVAAEGRRRFPAVADFKRPMDRMNKSPQA